MNQAASPMLLMMPMIVCRGSGVSGKSDAWDTGGPLYETLDQYNNGELCAPPM